MSKVAIVTDSTVNLPQEVMTQYGIHCLAQILVWDNKTYRDLIDIQPIEFYQRLAHVKTMPKTSQVSPEEFKTMVLPLLEQGYQVLAILVSAALSGTVQSALLAKEMLPAGAPLEIFDSFSVSLALGFQVLMAARAAQQGASLSECIEIAKQARQNSGVIFVVDTLEFLHRNGRIGGAARFLGTALNLKPILEVTGGKIEGIERVPTQRKAFARLLELIGERVDNKRPLHLSVLDANAPESAKHLREKAVEIFHPDEIIMGTVSPVIGANAGPGTVGIAYLTGM
jgi:DegV family protein with EDD domain